MCFRVLMLLLCVSPAELSRDQTHRQTEEWYKGMSYQNEEQRTDVTLQRSSLGHTRRSRAVQGGEVTINTLPDNFTRVVDSAKYYTWQNFGPEDRRTHELWVDMNDLRHGQVRVHGILSNSYKQAVRVALSFDFPFYGHYLRQIAIATGGFIFTGDVTHRMLTMTQYIAPLMANFDPGFSKESTVQYLDNGQVFVVQWERVRLSGRESEGPFTFQAALHKTGVITFSYREIPLSLDVIGSAEHPVKVGLSDAFMIKSSASRPAAQQKIFEYHRVQIDRTKISSFCAVEFTPLPTCLQHNNCELCLSSDKTTGCSWCNVLQRCSDGMDRHRQEWLDYSCEEEMSNATCEEYSRDHGYSSSPVPPEMEGMTRITPIGSCVNEDIKINQSSKGKGLVNSAVVAGLAAAVVLLLALMLVALYISCHPAAASPQLLIQRRKSYWPSLRFEKQKPGYTDFEGEGHERYSIVEA